jgi:hypothetical protein
MSITVFDDLRKEFSVNDNGISFVSKKGLARLCGIDAKRWFRKDSVYLFNKNLDQYIVGKLKIEGGENKQIILETLVSKGFIGGGENASYQISDILIDIVTKYYNDFA